MPEHLLTGQISLTDIVADFAAEIPPRSSHLSRVTTFIVGATMGLMTVSLAGCLSVEAVLVGLMAVTGVGSLINDVLTQLSAPREVEDRKVDKHTLWVSNSWYN